MRVFVCVCDGCVHNYTLVSWHACSQGWVILRKANLFCQPNCQTWPGLNGLDLLFTYNLSNVVNRLINAPSWVYNINTVPRYKWAYMFVFFSSHWPVCMRVSRIVQPANLSKHGNQKLLLGYPRSLTHIDIAGGKCCWWSHGRYGHICPNWAPRPEASWWVEHSPPSNEAERQLISVDGSNISTACTDALAHWWRKGRMAS